MDASKGPAEPVVKALEWLGDEEFFWPDGILANSVLGMFRIKQGHPNGNYHLIGPGVDERFNQLADAKAAGQNILNATILSALTQPAPAQAAGGEAFGTYVERSDGVKEFRRTGEPHSPSACAYKAWRLYTAPSTPDAELEALRERCKQAARNSCLVEPDGGEPTDAEALAAERAAEAVSRVPLREA